MTIISFKCPMCTKWKLNKGDLKQHIIDQHHYERPFKLMGVGANVRVEFMSRLPHSYPANEIDYRRKITLPVRDMHRDGEVVCCMDVYGLTTSDLASVPDGSEMLMASVRRLGMDPARYQVWLWDIPPGVK